MKCKYCGSQINERQRFCSNCGRTVRHISSTNKTNAVRNPRPQNARGQQPGRGSSDSFKNYDRYMREKQKRAREQRMKKVRFHRFIVFVILLAIIIGIIGFVVAFNKTKQSGVANLSDLEASLSPSPSADPNSIDNSNNGIMVVEDGSSPSPSASASSSPSASASAAPATSSSIKEGYSAYNETTTGISCPYPSDYGKSDSVAATTKVSVTDGKAQMRINIDKATTQDTAQSVLKSYSSGIGVEPSESTAGDGIYTISFVRNGNFNHRTGVLYGGKHIYYDFTCAENLSGNVNYTEVMKYADDSLKQQIERLKSEE